MERKVIKVKRTVERNILEKGEGASSNGDGWLHQEVFVEEIFDQKVWGIIGEMSEKVFPSVNNFYKDSSLRQSNLEKYFNALFWKRPSYMFIGEAPGVHGCALTGIPFTSERVIRDGITNHHFNGTRFMAEGHSYEGSASYFWQMINRMPKPPVLWNVFPLHPYKMVNGEMKNRAPKEAEKAWGQEILLKVLGLFPSIHIITVGNHARTTCEKLKIKTSGHIIHPAHHVNEFREQFRIFL
ncbi:uracil-DNA glycosylase [Alicyclobacillus fodiniaquatilis]|uniref:Uracil-DNA glycosylase n=1 Tax=Alicyclobacillus fodiniaquatilis TaxID=1661150 RepID=A0ABW4JJX6_9BACL